MSSKQITEKKKPTSKDAILQEITMQLSVALTSLKETLGEKKFDKRIKKAAKLLSEGIKSTATKKAAAPKPVAGKLKDTTASVTPPAKKTAKKVAAAKSK